LHYFRITLHYLHFLQYSHYFDLHYFAVLALLIICISVYMKVSPRRVLKFLPLIFGSETSKQVKWVRKVRVNYFFAIFYFFPTNCLFLLVRKYFRFKSHFLRKISNFSHFLKIPTAPCGIFFSYIHFYVFKKII
jgi:hypothetical protein